MTTAFSDFGARFQKCFKRLPTITARAPGRIEFLGNHTDYNGGAVLGVAVDREIRVAVAPRDDEVVELASDRNSYVRLSLNQIQRQSGGNSWANYPLGVFRQLRESGLGAENGFSLMVMSNLPAGAGMSSSAAFELASVEALCALYAFKLEPVEKVRLARAAENKFVGVPCGILDQGVSGFGQADGLVYINCDTETFNRYAIPAETRFWIFNSNKKHSLVDSMYATRHDECMQAARILNSGGSKKPLAHREPVEVEAHASKLGSERTRRALHITREHRRVLAAVDYLKAGDLEATGNLLLASHRSSRDLFENSIPELDVLVDLLETQPGVLGARLTGGGFGGAVMAWTRPEFSEDQAQDVCHRYALQFDEEPTVLSVQAAEGAGLLKNEPFKK